jgi:dethiobiotin synthetase
VLERDEFAVKDLAGEITWPAPEPEVRWVETVGGVRSPIAFDGDSVDLCDALAPDVVLLVADAGLGTINSVRLSTAALVARRVLVYLNRYDDSDELHRLNRAWLEDRDGFEIAVAPEQVRP